MTWPTPPRWRPGPPLSAQSSLRWKSTGASVSRISHGVIVLFSGYETGTIPSSVGIPPRPPCGSMSTRYVPRSGSRPMSTSGQIPPPLAWTFSPKIGQSAPNSTWLMLFVVFARALTGAGKVALRMLPSGAVTWIGRNRPSLFGVSGASAHLNGYMDVAYVLL